MRASSGIGDADRGLGARRTLRGGSSENGRVLSLNSRLLTGVFVAVSAYGQGRSARTQTLTQQRVSLDGPATVFHTRRGIGQKFPQVYRFPLERAEANIREVLGEAALASLQEKGDLMRGDAVRVFGLIIEGRRHLLRARRLPEGELQPLLVKAVKMELDWFLASDPDQFVLGKAPAGTPTPRAFPPGVRQPGAAPQFKAPLYLAKSGVASVQVTLGSQKFWADPRDAAVIQETQRDPHWTLQLEKSGGAGAQDLAAQLMGIEDGLRINAFLAFAAQDGVALH
jgi:hypothetical protein